MKKLSKILIITACVISAGMSSPKSFAADYSGGLVELNNTLESFKTKDLNRNFAQQKDILLGSDLPNIENSGSTVSVTGNNHSINGASAFFGFSIQNNQELDLSGLNSVKNFNATSRMGSVINSNGTITIYSSSFSNNRNSTHFGNGTQGYGGVIYGNGGLIDINKSDFSNNTTTSSSIDNEAIAKGGTIYNQNSPLTIDNTNFATNSSTAAGTQNAISALASGGAIYNTSSVTSISNSIFTNNFASATSTIDGVNSSAYGGALYNEAGQYLTIKDSQFTGNYSSSTGYIALAKGGAIYNDSSNLTILNTTFSNNSSLSNSSETNSNSLSAGGAINNNGGSLSIFDSNFAHNTLSSISNTSNLGYVLTAEAHGGAIFNSAGNTNINDSIFSQNTISSSSNNTWCEALGGSVYNKSGTITINNSQFSENKVLSTATLNTSSVVAGGGAIYNKNGAVLIINNGTFTNNSVESISQGFGGAIYNNGTSTINNSSFTGNYVHSIGSNYSYSFGGAIENSSGILTINNCVFSGNFGSSTHTTNGGAMHNYSGSKTTIINSTFSNNYANTTGDWSGPQGGVIYNFSDTKIINSDFTGNSSTAQGSNTASNGGAISNQFGSPLTLVDSNFTNNSTNSVSAKGGAIYNGQGTVYIIANNRNSEFTGNTSNGSGNDIYNDDGTLNINAGVGDVIFNSGINNSNGYASTAAVNINKTLSVDLNGDGINESAPTNGRIILNSPWIGTGVVTIYNGVLKVGVNGLLGAANSRISNLTLGGSSILDLANADATDTVYTNTLTTAASSTPSIWYDVDLLHSQNDKLNFNSSAINSAYNINTIRMLSDVANSGAILLGGGGSLTGYPSFHTYTNDYDYTVSAANKALSFTRVTASANINKGLAAAIIGSAIRSFSLTNNLDIKADLPNLPSGTLTVFGTGKSGYYISGGDDTVDGNGNYKLFNIDSGATLNIVDTGIKNAFSSTGGGVAYNNGNLNIYNSSVTDSNTTGLNISGGAIYNNGSLKISDSDFTANSANDTGFNSTASGGAILNEGDLLINHSSFTGNVVSTAGDETRAMGGAIFNANRPITISGSNFSNNEAIANGEQSSARGGAIDNAGTLNIYHSTFDSNEATATTTTGTVFAHGGAIHNQMGTLTIGDSIFSNNSATAQGQESTVAGGAIYNNENLIINKSSFSQNSISSIATDPQDFSSANGGAIYNNTGANLAISNSDFSKNTTNAQGTMTQTTGAMGGAIYNDGIANLTNITFSENKAIASSDTTDAYAFAGAIYNKSNLTVRDSSFNLNSVTASAPDGIAVGNGGAIYNNGGTTTIYNSSFTDNSASTAGGAIYNNGGVVNLIADAGHINFTGNTANGLGNDIYLANSSTLNLNAILGEKITFNGGISSDSISNSININKSHDDNDSTTAPSGAPISGEVILNAAIADSTVNLYGGTLSLSDDSYLDGNALTFNGGTLNMINSKVGTMALNSLILGDGSTTNLKIDVDLANKVSDKITGTYLGGTGILNVSRINLLSDAKTDKTNVSFLSPEIAANATVEMGVKRAYTPIYQYNINYDKATGNLAFEHAASGGGGGGGFNPAVITAPVSANVGAYMGQVNIYNEVLNRSELFMSLPQSERMLMRNQNKVAFADASETQVFSPLFTPEDSGGLWVKQYSTFENIPLKNGPNVSNVGYGMIIGGDTPLKHLKHGFDGYLTTYVGYNGSHQNYDNIGVYQNGGALGLTGTVYKGNFFSALTATIGESSGQANTMYGVDNFNTLLAGVALKSGYNIEFARGKFILQPSLLASYTFANTFDYKTASGVNISSNPLNAIQLVPGVKLISNMENGWQPYLAANMVFNIMDAQKFMANDVMLPQMSINPYVEYGIGIQRRWGNRFSGFGQAMLRGGGRNGIALQFGFRYALGK